MDIKKHTPLPMIEKPIVKAKLAIMSNDANLMIAKCSIGPSSKGSTVRKWSTIVCSLLIENDDDNTGD